MTTKLPPVPAATDSACYCGSTALFAQCCGPLLAGERVAASAEQLMRSRYSAFVVANEDYLLATWHPRTRPSRVRFTVDQRWLGLQVVACHGGGVADVMGTVEFVARTKRGGKAQRLHERSEFRKLDGCWFYLEGQHL